MSVVKGTNIASTIVPFTTEDNYATHDSLYGKGGYREVLTLKERDRIPKERLRVGCIVYVEDERQEYRYLADGSWGTVDGSGATLEEVERLGEEVANLQETKVDKVEGMGLSTNDFNNLYKDSLDNLDPFVKNLIKTYSTGNIVLTHKEYTALGTYDNSTTYVIIENNALIAIYVGRFLVAVKGNGGISTGFPYNLPITF